MTLPRLRKASGPSPADYWRLARHGGLLRAWSYFWQTHVFDIVHRTDTAHWRPKASFDPALPGIEHGYHYEAAYTSEVLRCLAIAKRHVAYAEADFFDLGCGKGKVLLVAGRTGFRSATGIEYDPGLAGVARTNLHARRVDARILEMDARRFAGYAAKNVVYLFNPFDADVLRTVVDNIERHADECLLIYTNPTHADVLAHWSLVAATQGHHSSLTSRIYRFRKAAEWRDGHA